MVLEKHLTTVNIHHSLKSTRSVELACSCQFEFELLGCCAPVHSCYVSLALVPQTQEREGVCGGEEGVVVAVEKRALFASQVAEGFEPRPHGEALLPLSLWMRELKKCFSYYLFYVNN